MRELEAETTLDTRIVLVGGGDPARVEAGISEAASLAVHLLRAGAQVAVAGPGLEVPLGRGPEHRRRVLTALALWEPPGTPALSPDADPRPRRGRGQGEGTNVRELRVSLG